MDKAWQLTTLEEVGFVKNEKGWQDTRAKRMHTIYRNAQMEIVEFDSSIKQAPDSVQKGRPDSLFICPFCTSSMSFHGSENYRRAYVAHNSHFALLSAWCVYLKRTKKFAKNKVNIRRGIITEKLSRSLKSADPAELLLFIENLITSDLKENYTKNKELIERLKELEDKLKMEKHQKDKFESDFLDLQDEFEKFKKEANRKETTLKNIIYRLENKSETETEKQLKIAKAEKEFYKNRLSEVYSQKFEEYVKDIKHIPNGILRTLKQKIQRQENLYGN